MSAALTKPAISATDLETAAQKLWNEFLKSYFDGTMHDIGTEPILFPLCEIGFNQMTPDLTGPMIHVIFVRLTQDRDWQAPAAVEGIRVKADATINFFIRVANAGQKKIGADPECQIIGDRLRLIFDLPNERARLAAKGILHAKIQAGPTPQPFPAIQVRLLTITAELIYRI